MAHRILIVEDNPSELSAVIELLRQADYDAMGAAGFEEASRIVTSTPPDLLVTDVRLGAFNGLHLVLRGRTVRRDMAAIVVSGFADKVLESEAQRQGATYLLKPLDPASFLEAVGQALAGRNRERRWRRKRIAQDLPVKVDSAEAQVIDVSYGGFRLEMPAVPERSLPVAFNVVLPSAGLSVKAEMVWSRRVGTPCVFWCGAAVTETDLGARTAWRRLVDELPG